MLNLVKIRIILQPCPVYQTMEIILANNLNFASFRQEAAPQHYWLAVGCTATEGGGSSSPREIMENVLSETFSL